MEVTFLKEEQIVGKDALRLMKSFEGGVSDLAILLGSSMQNLRTRDEQRVGWIWSASPGRGPHAKCFALPADRDITTLPDSLPIHSRRGAACPALPQSETSIIPPEEIKWKGKIHDIPVVEYGEYPQTIAPSHVKQELEEAFSAGTLGTTNKKYTFDGEDQSYNRPFKPTEYAEYEHHGRRYIRLEAQKPYSRSCVLSNGRQAQAGEACWIEVQPIEWLVDPTGLWLARQGLFSGVPFDSRSSNYTGNFANTEISRYLVEHFSKEMQVNRKVEQQQNTSEENGLTGQTRIAAHQAVASVTALTPRELLIKQREERAMKGRRDPVPPEAHGR